jgi:DNA-binding NarL/FixJ family response regulator
MIPRRGGGTPERARRRPPATRRRRGPTHGEPGSRLRVVIAGQHPAFNLGVRHMLETGGVTVVALTASPDELVSVGKTRRVAVAIVDVESGANWVKAVPKLKAANPRVAVVAVTGIDNTVLHSRVLSLGCSSVLSKRATTDAFLQAVHGAGRGYGLIEVDLLAKVMAGREAGQGQITVLERDILRCLADGLPNRKIAGRLNYSVSTVKNYIHNVLQKLGASSRTAAVVRALRSGIID